MSGNPADFLEILIPILIALGIGLGIGFIIRWIVLNSGSKRYSSADSGSSSETANKLFGLFLEGLTNLVKLVFFILIWLAKVFVYLILLLVSLIRRTPPPSFSSMFPVHQNQSGGDNYDEYSEGENKHDDYHV
jgi:hypothetical protein